MRKLFVLIMLAGALAVAAGEALADPNLTLQATLHRHFIDTDISDPDNPLVEVGPRWCDHQDNPAVKRAFTQFHANAHTSAGVTGEIGPQAPGLHNLAGSEITSIPGC
jgi:hypothetical protein